MSDKEETIIYEMQEKEEKKPISIIWILPLIIFLILSWVAYESYMTKGTTITVSFKSAEGIKENVTPLEYKGLQMGKVSKISINKDLKTVDVKILVKNDVAKYVASESSRFWIKKPTITLTKISGLNTLINGYTIELSPKFRTQKEYEKGKKQYNFQGLETQPDDSSYFDGYYIRLIGVNKSVIGIGTPIFYNNFQIGEVVSKDFKNDQLYLNIYIYDKFNYLVNQSSKFVLNEALNVNFGPSGFNVELSSLYSMIVGGISVITPNKNAPKIDKNEINILYENKEELKQKEFFNISFFDADSIGENTPIIYKGITIGKIISLDLTTKNIISKAFIYKKYKYLLTKNTEFFIQKPKVSLDGVKNLGNIIKGNYISLNYKKGEYSNNFIIKETDNPLINKEDIIISLYSDNLNSISKKSKVYYKNIEIGKIINYKLTKSLRKVKIDILIYKKYKDVVNDHSLFYDMSSKLIEIKNLDLNVNYSGIEPLLNGSIGIATEKRKKILAKKEFKLYSSYKDVERLKKIYNKGFLIDAYFSNDLKIKANMSIIYKNQEIGFVKSISFDEKKSKATLFIYKKFKKYINSKNRFYKKAVVNFNASLDGIIFEIDNFTSLIEGSIHLDTSSKTKYPQHLIFASEDAMKISSNSVKIIFDDVEGIKKEFSKLTFKGVNVGKVTNIRLNSKHKIEIEALIDNDFNSFAREGTIFYLKKPKISLQEIKNLDSSILPVNIGIIKSTKRKYKSKFIGYEEKPLSSMNSLGTIFKIEDHLSSNIGVSSPIYYKNVQIGKVVKVDLSKDASFVVIDALIYNKYKKFIRKNSDFYDISGFEMEFSLFGESKVKSNTLTSLISGGLIVVTPLEYSKRAKSKDKFILKKEIPENWKEISPSIK